MRTTTVASSGSSPSSVRLAADHRERAAVDLGAVPDVLGHARHGRRDTRCSTPAGWPQRRSHPDQCSLGEEADRGAARDSPRQRARRAAPWRRRPCPRTGREARPARVRRDDETRRRERVQQRLAVGGSTSSSVSVRQGERRSSPGAASAAARRASAGSRRASGGSAVTATRPSFCSGRPRLRARAAPARRAPDGRVPAEQAARRVGGPAGEVADPPGRPVRAGGEREEGARCVSAPRRAPRRGRPHARRSAIERQREAVAALAAISATSAREPSARPLPSSIAKRKRPGSAASASSSQSARSSSATISSVGASAPGCAPRAGSRARCARARAGSTAAARRPSAVLRPARPPPPAARGSAGSRAR